MYKPSYTKAGLLKHSNECTMAFGRKDAQCPRCAELINGAAPRDHAGFTRLKQRALDEAMQIKWIKEHCCSTENCGNVCTAFEW